MVSVSMFDTDKIYFDSMSALEHIIHTLLEMSTNESFFSLRVVTTIPCLHVEKIFM